MRIDSCMARSSNVIEPLENYKYMASQANLAIGPKYKDWAQAMLLKGRPTPLKAPWF